MRRVAHQTNDLKSEVLLHSVLFFFFYRRRLYFKSLSSGETEKEKYFLVLQVSFYFSVFLFINGGILSHLSFLMWSVWEGFVITGLSVLDPDFCKRSDFPSAYLYPPKCPFLVLFRSRKVALWCMDDR